MLGKTIALILLLVMVAFTAFVFVQALQLSGGLRNLLLGLLIGFIFVVIGAFNGLIKMQGGWQQALEALTLKGLKDLWYLVTAIFVYLLSLFGLLMAQLLLQSLMRHF